MVGPDTNPTQQQPTATSTQPPFSPIPTATPIPTRFSTTHPTISTSPTHLVNISLILNQQDSNNNHNILPPLQPAPTPPLLCLLHFFHKPTKRSKTPDHSAVPGSKNADELAVAYCACEFAGTGAGAELGG
jgi:hypothetical protein